MQNEKQEGKYTGSTKIGGNFLSNDLARILPLQARRGISGEMNCQSCTLVNNRAGSSGSYASTLVPRHFAQFHAALNF